MAHPRHSQTWLYQSRLYQTARLTYTGRQLRRGYLIGPLFTNAFPQPETHSKHPLPSAPSQLPNMDFLKRLPTFDSVKDLLKHKDTLCSRPAAYTHHPASGRRPLSCPEACADTSAPVKVNAVQDWDSLLVLLPHQFRKFAHNAAAEKRGAGFVSGMKQRCGGVFRGG